MPAHCAGSRDVPTLPLWPSFLRHHGPSRAVLVVVPKGSPGQPSLLALRRLENDIQVVYRSCRKHSGADALHGFPVALTRRLSRHITQICRCGCFIICPWSRANTIGRLLLFLIRCPLSLPSLLSTHSFVNALNSLCETR